MDLSQHFPESEAQPNDVSICRLFDIIPYSCEHHDSGHIKISPSLSATLFRHTHIYTFYVINKYTPSFTDTLSLSHTHTHTFSLSHTHGAGSDITGQKLRMCAGTYAVLCTKTTVWYELNITENIFILSTRTTRMHCPILLLV